MTMPPCRIRRAFPMVLTLILALACAGLPSSARADGEDGGGAIKPAPRTAVEIGGVSVVLVSANNKLHAFVDRLADNAPAPDAELTVKMADGTDVKLERAAGGFFVGPFDRAGRMNDAFLVSVTSADGTGEVGAEIAYDDLPAGVATGGSHDLIGKLWIALAAAALGAVLATMVLRWVRNRRHAGAGRPAPAA